MRRPHVGLLLIVGTGVIWGTIGVAAKLTYRHSSLDAVGVTWIRAMIAAIGFGVLGLRSMGRGLFRLPRHDGGLMVMFGIVLILYQYLYLAAVDQIGVSTATLITLCTPPAMVAIASTLLWRHAMTARTAAALVGALIGTALVVGWQASAGEGSRPLGVVLALLSAAGIATHVMGSRHLAGTYPPLQPLTISFATGAIVLAPIALVRGIAFDQPAKAWGWLLYLGVVTSCVAYLLYQRGLRDVDATTASVITLLEPLVAAVLAWVLFEERLGITAALGGALLIASIVLISTGGSNATSAARSPRTVLGETL